MNAATPQLILLLASIFVTMFIVGMVLIHGKASKLRFLSIWGLSLVISIVILTGFIFMPNTVDKITQFFQGVLT